MDLCKLLKVIGRHVPTPEPDDEEQRRAAFVARMMLEHPGMPREEAEEAFDFLRGSAEVT